MSKGDSRAGEGYDLARGIREGCLEEVTLKTVTQKMRKLSMSKSGDGGPGRGNSKSKGSEQ